MPIRIVSWNVNGLRAATSKRFGQHVATLKPDALMLQETRTFPEQLKDGWSTPEGWHPVWHPADRPGYAGVATWTRTPQWVSGVGLPGSHGDGRVLRTRWGKLELVNVYLPSGSASPEAQERKDRFMVDFLPWSAALAAQDRPVLLAGDLNIAHTENDIWNPGGSKRISGFLPHEREWFTTLLAAGWTDLLRTHAGPVKGPYSWWSNRGRARAEDRGWRIDYVLGNAAAAARLRNAWVHRPGGLDTSDHAPVVVDLSSR
ncbi:MAG: exodeoxyribonuclease-3 [Myxococcota bacterium]|jgi:exodeoxyribonuclease-3